MLICGLQKLSLVDYPGKLAATIFTGGCNMRCPFCHNASLVTHISEEQQLSEEYVLNFLAKRVGKLDGVCISGGEPLLQPDLEDFIKKVRALGFLVKLDTNGSEPYRLRTLLEKNLLDYVAMDIKNSPEKYSETAGVEGFDSASVFECAKIIMSSGVPYEFRTTLVRGLHEPEDIEAIGRLLSGAEKYYLQSFKDSGDLVGFGVKPALEMTAFSKNDIDAFRNILLRHIKSVEIRG